MEGDTARAVKVLDAGLEKIPFSQIRHTYVSTIPHIESYYLAGAYDKGNAVLEDYARVLEEYILYYTKFEGRKADMIFSRMQQDIQLLDELHRIATVLGQKKPAQDIEDFFSRLGL